MKTIRELHDAAGSYKIADWGDAIEKEQTAFIYKYLPAYEAWWQLVVFPFREQPGIWLKLKLPRNHEALAIYNYSLFRSSLRSFDILVEAQRRHAETGEVGSDLFYDFCIWIAMSYERIRQQAGAAFDYLFSESPKIPKNITRWDKIGQKKLFARLPTGFVDRFEIAYRDVASYRNNIIHGPKFPGGKDRVPKPKEVKSLVYWSKFGELAQCDKAEWETRTVERFDMMIELWLNFEDVANEFLEGLTATVLEQLGTERFRDHDLADLPSGGSEGRHPWTVSARPEKSGNLGERFSSDTTFPS